MDAPETSPKLFASHAELRIVDASRAASVLSLVAGTAAHRGPGRAEVERVHRVAEQFASAVRAAAASASGSVALARPLALDLAAELVEVADVLFLDGRSLEGFALEGIEARLLEALVAGGTCARG